MSRRVRFLQYTTHGRSGGAPGRPSLPLPAGEAMGASRAEAAALLPMPGGQWPLYFGEPTFPIKASQHRIGIVLIGAPKF